MGVSVYIILINRGHYMKKLTIYLGSAVLIASGCSYAQSGLSDSSVQNQKTTLAHTHTQEQNSSHQKFCDQLGGVDISDDSDIQMGTNTIDAIFCKITDRTKFLRTIPYATMGNVNDAGEPQLSSAVDSSDIITQMSQLAPNGTFRAYASNGTVKMGQNWYCTGTGDYLDVYTQVSVREEVPTFGCSASNGGYITSGTVSATAVCGPRQGVTSTFNYATACAGGCAQAKGTINFQP